MWLELVPLIMGHYCVFVTVSGGFRPCMFLATVAGAKQGRWALPMCKQKIQTWHPHLQSNFGTARKWSPISSIRLPFLLKPSLLPLHIYYKIYDFTELSSLAVYIYINMNEMVSTLSCDSIIIMRNIVHKLFYLNYLILF